MGQLYVCEKVMICNEVFVGCLKIVSRAYLERLRENSENKSVKVTDNPAKIWIGYLMNMCYVLLAVFYS
jgi:hypothetical protein